MRGILKALAAGIALTAPIGFGWAYTAGATVGDGGSALGSLFEDETVDEFAVNDFLITRESHNGAVSMSVLGPDGSAVDLGDLPGDIADRVDFYESEWTPALSGAVFDSEGGETCYVLDEDLTGDVTIDVVEDDNDTTRVLLVMRGDDGGFDVRAVEFDSDDLSPEQRQAILDGPEEALDAIDGGTELAPCDD